jgi:predicted PurR-regulated permease PerM
LAREVLVPVALSAVLVALLLPVVAGLRRRRVPAPAGAALAVVATLALLVAVGIALGPPLRGVAADLPRSITAARARLQRLAPPLARLGIAPASRDSARPSRDSVRAPAARPPASATPPNPSEAGGSSANAPAGILAAAGRAFGVASGLVLGAVEVLLLTFFALAASARWREKLDAAVTSSDARGATLGAAEEMRQAVARYVVVTTLINLGQGVLVAVVMWAIGLPSPFLWGVLTFLAEFVPYLGGFAMIILLLVAGLASGAGLLRVLLAPASYLAITTLQNNLVSPAAYGRGLRLNPTAILVAVMFWWWAWGAAGALLAVPILAALRILGNYVRALRPVAVFLAE